MADGSVGPRSESLSLSLSMLGLEGGCGGESGLWSRGAGGREGPITFRRLGEDGESGGEGVPGFCRGTLSERELGFEISASIDAASSSWARFLLASKCGGREGPMEAIMK